MVCQLMMYSNVPGMLASPFLVARTSASLTNVGGLAVRAFDLVNCSLSGVGSVPVFHVSQQASPCNVVVGL